MSAPDSVRMPSKSFQDRVDSAAYYEAWAATVLCRAGLCVLHYPFDIRANEDKDLTEPDLIVARDIYNCEGYELCGPTEVEVKSLSLTFNNTDSYPFDDVLICSQSSFLRKWPGRDYICRDFLLVSKPTGAIIWVPAMTKVTLGKEVHDKARNETYKAVYTSRDNLRPLADFVDMVKDV